LAHATAAQRCHHHTLELAPARALQAAVAVRSAPGSSILKDVAPLKDGDTFGELALMVSHAAATIPRQWRCLTSAVKAWQVPSSAEL
jgi:hypothetical protein